MAILNEILQPRHFKRPVSAIFSKTKAHTAKIDLALVTLNWNILVWFPSTLCLQLYCQCLFAPLLITMLLTNGRLLNGWLVVFYAPSTARSFRDGTPIYCPLRRTWSLLFTPFPPGSNPGPSLPLRNASSTNGKSSPLTSCVHVLINRVGLAQSVACPPLAW